MNTVNPTLLMVRLALSLPEGDEARNTLLTRAARNRSDYERRYDEIEARIEAEHHDHQRDSTKNSPEIRAEKVQAFQKLTAEFENDLYRELKQKTGLPWRQIRDGSGIFELKRDGIKIELQATYTEGGSRSQAYLTVNGHATPITWERSEDLVKEVDRLLNQPEPEKHPKWQFWKHASDRTYLIHAAANFPAGSKARRFILAALQPSPPEKS